MATKEVQAKKAPVTVRKPSTVPQGPAVRPPRAGKAAKTAGKAAKQEAAGPSSAKPAAVPATGKAKLRGVKAPVAKTVTAKLVRDSFTMPQADFDLIAALKKRALKFQRPAKKSELLRAGLHALQALDDASLHAGLDALVVLKPGRPKASD